MGLGIKKMSTVLKKKSLTIIMSFLLLTVFVGLPTAHGADLGLTFTPENSYLSQPVGWVSEYYRGTLLLSASSSQYRVHVTNITASGDVYYARSQDELPRYIYRGSPDGINMLIQLKPSHLGTCTGAIHVETRYSGTQDIPITMTGVAGTYDRYVSLAYNPSGGPSGHYCVFPDTKIGKSSEKTITITFHQAMEFGGCSYLDQPPAGAFSLVSHTCYGDKARGQTCTVNFKYTPTQTGETSSLPGFNARRSIGSSYCGGGFYVRMKGNCINPNAAYTPTSLSFPDTATGQQSTQKTITISNNGTTDLLLTGKTLSDWTNYTVSSNTCTAVNNTLSPGSSCSIGIKFKPQSAGSKAATYKITTND
jgi:hypothetical protein